MEPLPLWTKSEESVFYLSRVVFFGRLLGTISLKIVVHKLGQCEFIFVAHELFHKLFHCKALNKTA